MKNKICVNQLGYTLYGGKKAVCIGNSSSGAGFGIVDSESEKVMFAGKLSEPVFDRSSGDMTSEADFSYFCRPGKYYIRSGRKRSHDFIIAEKPYTSLKSALIKSFYYNRCGATDEAYAGEFAHESCHTKPAYIFGEYEKTADASGGWHDSGGYGKYVTTACIAVAHMLYAYRLFPHSFADKNTIPDAPENVPDILCECRKELEWLLKMQRRDGGVYHKVCTAEVSAFVLPEKDNGIQYIMPCSHQATAYFVAAVALASGVYADFDTDFSDLLQSAAFSGWIWLENHKEYKPFTNPREIKHFAAGDAPDRNFDDSLFWTVCELYALTGDKVFLERIDALCRTVCATGFSFCAVGGFGSLAYMLCKYPKDVKTERLIRLKFRIEADNIVSLAEKSGYRTARSPEDYKIFSNISITENAVILICAYRLLLCGDYIKTAAEQFNYILGKNPMGICYVTGMGTECVKNPHHRLSVFSDSDDPVPGLVVTGACADDDFKDDYAKWNLPPDTPPAKCYCDNSFCHSSNETSICGCAALLFVTAFFDSPDLV